MFTSLYLLLSIALLFWLIAIYNRLVKDKNRVFAAWSDIDVQLKRRHDLIPKLIEIVKSYSNYERKTLDEITQLRTQSSLSTPPADRAVTENHLGSHMKKLLVIMEDYPDLKADAQYLSLQTNLSQIENDIQSARRYYNGCVRNLNIRIDSFPDLCIARLFNYQQADFFELDPIAKLILPH